MLGNTKTIPEMGLESIIGRMAMFMKGNGQKEIKMDGELIFGRIMEIDLKENGEAT